MSLKAADPARAVFNQNFELALDIPIQKACWFELEETLYAWQAGSSLIHIYHQDKKVNTIGRDRTKLQKPADIALAPDGNLYILDSTQKTILCSGRKGLMISALQLPSDIYPVKFTVSKDYRFYIFDQNSEEFIVYDSAGNEEFRFGAIDISSPIKLTVYGQTLSVYCNDDTTYFYTRLGQFTGRENGNCYKTEDQLIKLEKYFITNTAQIKMAVSIDPWSEYFYDAPNFILINKNKIITGNIKYE